ncbi:MAG: CsiV family protein [Spiribacter sp.]|nr:CsiV family protein [Spiribacter sp.]
MKRGVWLILSLLLAAPQAMAQSESSPPRYQVEVIVFTQPPLDDAERAQAKRHPPLPLPGRAWPLRDRPRAGFGYARLDSSQYQLSSAAQRIDAQPGFAVHWHAAWQQPGLAENRAQAVALPRALRQSGLTGRIRIDRARFLHVDVDLQYTESPESNAPSDEAPRYWVVDDSLRMRSDEQHYLDHPRLGVIVRIDPVPAEQSGDSSTPN